MSKQAHAKDNSKEASIIQLIQKPLKSIKGASIDESDTVTGWQANPSRAFLTGLCKKGYDVILAKRKDVRTSDRLLRVSTSRQDSAPLREYKKESKQQEIA